MWANEVDGYVVSFVGHAFIGLYLAKELLAKGHDVTIFNDGDAVSNRNRGLRKG
jgi:nucleoside-diphosphate-sugar epimerase